jgi:SAM-dependent methyltransferase
MLSARRLAGWGIRLGALLKYGGGLARVGTSNSAMRYANQLHCLRAAGLDHEAAMQRLVGGEFDAVGTVTSSLLVQLGLRPDDYLVDVGCGAGRLTRKLAEYLRGRYLGTDVLPALVEHARKAAGGPHWRFEVVRSLRIPERDGEADMVCFFSVLTHLLHEECYVYLREAKRVLRPGGKVVFTFLEYGCASHWQCFEDGISNIGTGLPLVTFIGRDAIDAWSSRLGLRVVAVHGGEEPFVRRLHQVVFEGGQSLEGLQPFAQSLCVLEKPA